MPLLITANALRIILYTITSQMVNSTASSSVMKATLLIHHQEPVSCAASSADNVLMRLLALLAMKPPVTPFRLKALATAQTAALCLTTVHALLIFRRLPATVSPLPISRTEPALVPVELASLRTRLSIVFLARLGVLIALMVLPVLIASTVTYLIKQITLAFVLSDFTSTKNSVQRSARQQHSLPLSRICCLASV